MDKNKKIDTILYSPTRTYYFQADKSSGKESDLITFINVPYVVSTNSYGINWEWMHLVLLLIVY